METVHSLAEKPMKEGMGAPELKSNLQWFPKHQFAASLPGCAKQLSDKSIKRGKSFIVQLLIKTKVFLLYAYYQLPI
jgi:hypothetical protein